MTVRQIGWRLNRRNSRGKVWVKKIPAAHRRERVWKRRRDKKHGGMGLSDRMQGFNRISSKLNQKKQIFSAPRKRGEWWC